MTTLPQPGAKSARTSNALNDALPPGWLHTARFLTTAPTQRAICPHWMCPKSPLWAAPTWAKSTCINTLTSSKAAGIRIKEAPTHPAHQPVCPGQTGATDAVLADLPGYGYAAVPMVDKLRWQQMQ